MMRFNSFSMTAIFFFVFLSTCVAVPSTSVEESGKCPDVPSQDTFDVARYLGIWYEYVLFPNVFEPGLDCVRAAYEVKPTGVISVDNLGFQRVKEGGKYIIKKKFEINGNATICDPTRPAELCVQFVKSQPPPTKTNYKIIDTDYDSYTLIYACIETPEAEIEFAWVLTRKRGVEPTNFDKLKEKLSSRGVNVGKFKKVNQEQCDSMSPVETAEITPDQRPNSKRYQFKKIEIIPDL